MTKKKLFCNDTLSDYEKTMYSLAIAFGAESAYIMEKDVITDMAFLLNLDSNLLEKALNLCKNEIFPLKIGFKESTYTLNNSDYSFLFESLFKIYSIYKKLENLSDNISSNNIKNNYRILKDCISDFNYLNAIMNTFECKQKGYFTLNFAVFNNNNYQPKKHISIVNPSLYEYDCNMLKEEDLPFFYRIISHDLVTRVNAIYLVAISQIIKYSDFMNPTLKGISDEMYSYLLFILQNARIISVQTNFMFPTNSSKPENRGKNDNTTRLQLLYGYENFDTYVLRLDLAHKGQGFIHYNNSSPGGIKCCLFSKKEYFSHIKEEPVAKKFFQEYGNCYALKELSDLKLSDKEKELFEKIRVKKEHCSAFEKYDENDVVSFINIVSLMLPENCHVRIDIDGKHAGYCFNYDKIMFYATLLEIALLSENETEVAKLLKLIVTMASEYELISKDSIDDFLDSAGVCLIIDEAKKKTDPYNSY